MPRETGVAYVLLPALEERDGKSVGNSFWPKPTQFLCNWWVISG